MLFFCRKSKSKHNKRNKSSPKRDLAAAAATKRRTYADAVTTPVAKKAKTVAAAVGKKPQLKERAAAMEVSSVPRQLDFQFDDFDAGSPVR
jgi:hypothetical protein